MSLRSRSRPRSGFLAKGTLSHFGPPTAPSSTASAVMAFAIVASLTGRPSLSMAAPPTSASSTSKPTARRLPSQSMVRRTWRMTSGPMPSPGRIKSFLLAAMMDSGIAKRREDEGSGVHPGPGLAVALFETVDIARMLHGQADVVEALQQAFLAEGIDLEMHMAAIGAGDDL